MRRWVAILVVGAMLAVPAVSAASYPQTGYDSGRSGDIPFEGPQTNDTALEIELPGTPVGAPVIESDTAFVVTDDFGFEDLSARAVWAIDLATGNTTEVITLGEDMRPLFPNPIVASELLLVWDFDTYELVALEIPSGEERWRVGAFGVPDQVHPGNGYAGSVVAGDRLYAGYWINPPTGGDAVGVMAVDLDEGERLWTWNRTQEIRQDRREVQGEQIPVRVPDPNGGPDRMPGSVQLTTDGERVYPYLWHPEPRQQGELWALDADTGEAQWDHHDSMQTDGGFSSEGWAVAGDLRVYVRLDAFQAFNPETGEELWMSPAGRTDQIDVQGATPMGTTGDIVVGTSPQSVYRMDPDTGSVTWQHTLQDFPGSYVSGHSVVIDEEKAYLPLFVGGHTFSGRGIEARDLGTGELLWRWTDVPSAGFEDRNFATGKLAFAPGIGIVAAKDGVVHVIGETEASLGEPDVPDQKYPGVGNETTIDASGAEPGAFGNATRYMVDWGDGTISGWQESPEFSHTYNESGEYEAQIYAGNDANQTSSTFVTMNVGQEAPVEPNWIEERFEKDNQDMTFGVLGVALALGGGVVGVARRRRKKSILQEELGTLEEGFEDTKDNPGECEAFLETRKARARSLMMDGTLDEEQFGVIESRVEELGRKLRTSVLDERFQFLPYGLVQSLKKMLADGKISTWEREAVDTLLEDEEALSEQQREKVRHQIDRWLVEDAGRGER